MRFTSLLAATAAIALGAPRAAGPRIACGVIVAG